MRQRKQLSAVVLLAHGLVGRLAGADQSHLLEEHVALGLGHGSAVRDLVCVSNGHVDRGAQAALDEARAERGGLADLPVRTFLTVTTPTEAPTGAYPPASVSFVVTGADFTRSV